MSVTDIRAYHKIITDSYNERSKTYNESEWHSTRSKKLVDYVPPPEGGSVLDIATGTGTIAFYAASIVGCKGSVIAIDISEGMVAKAKELLGATTFKNIDFSLGDGENLAINANRFNRIYCGHAFFWMADKLATLHHWFDLLSPGGFIAFHAWPENSYVCGYVARQALKSHGIDYLAHSPTGTKEKCAWLLEEVGYEQIDIRVDSEGSYITLQEAKDSWIDESHYPIGQYPHPVSNISPDVLAASRADYEAEMERLNTDKGVWNNTTMYYVSGRKPVSI